MTMTRECTRVVGIGGGTGLSVLLAGLCEVGEELERTEGADLGITGVVSVADDGGSTGALRRHLGIPAVGDLRRCIVALAHGEPLWSELFQHRFEGGNGSGGDGLGGHSLGNLIMAALIERSGGLESAVDLLARPLGMRGRVLPVTDRAVTLCAQLEDGEIVAGESCIPARRRRVRRVWLDPRAPRPAAGVLEALRAADAIVLGPGSLYTSVLPNLLVDGIAAAVRGAPALKIFICNLMTQPGETDGFDAADHLRALEEYLGGPGAIDVCLVQSPEPPAEIVARYAEAGAAPVRCDGRGIRAAGAVPVFADLLARGPRLGRHDPVRLARTVVSLARSVRRQAPAPQLLNAPLLQPPTAAAVAARIG